LYQAFVIDNDVDDCGEIGGMKDWQVKPRYFEKLYPSTALSATNPTLFYPDWNPGRHRRNPESNSRSYDTTIPKTKLCWKLYIVYEDRSEDAISLTFVYQDGAVVKCVTLPSKAPGVYD
jgi:hypothetical protein